VTNHSDLSEHQGFCWPGSISFTPLRGQLVGRRNKIHPPARPTRPVPRSLKFTLGSIHPTIVASTVPRVQSRHWRVGSASRLGEVGAMEQGLRCAAFRTHTRTGGTTTLENGQYCLTATSQRLNRGTQLFITNYGSARERLPPVAYMCAVVKGTGASQANLKSTSTQGREHRACPTRYFWKKCAEPGNRHTNETSRGSTVERTLFVSQRFVFVGVLGGASLVAFGCFLRSAPWE